MYIRLRGHTGSRGRAEGEALVCHQPFGFFGIEEGTGIVYQPGHELHCKSIKDKIVVYPCGCGPVGYHLYMLKRQSINPKAIVNMIPYYHLVVDALFSEIPMVYGFDRNLLEVIQTGDHVNVNADEGIVTVSKKPC